MGCADKGWVVVCRGVRDEGIWESGGDRNLEGLRVKPWGG